MKFLLMYSDLISFSHFSGSYEQSPRFMEAYGDSLENENMGLGSGENQLREDLAEAMLETSVAPHRVPGKLKNTITFDAVLSSNLLSNLQHNLKKLLNNLFASSENETVKKGNTITIFNVFFQTFFSFQYHINKNKL